MALRPLDIEAVVDSKKELISETDKRGSITYVNQNFVELSGYSEEELIGTPHNILRHVDMPRTVFKLLWDALKAEKNYSAVVQNKQKGGKYYWVYSKYEIMYDKSKKVRGYRSRRFPVPKKMLPDIELIYKKLLALENTKSQENAETFLELKLHNDGFHDYSEYVEDLYEKKLKKAFWSFW